MKTKKKCINRIINVFREKFLIQKKLVDIKKIKRIDAPGCRYDLSSKTFFTEEFGRYLKNNISIEYWEALRNKKKIRLDSPPVGFPFLFCVWEKATAKRQAKKEATSKSFMSGRYNVYGVNRLENSRWHQILMQRVSKWKQFMVERSRGYYVVSRFLKNDETVFFFFSPSEPIRSLEYQVVFGKEEIQKRLWLSQKNSIHGSRVGFRIWILIHMEYGGWRWYWNKKGSEKIRS